MDGTILLVFIVLFHSIITKLLDNIINHRWGLFAQCLSDDVMAIED